MAQIHHDKSNENNDFYNYLKVNDLGQAEITAGGGSIDAFGRTRVSQVSTQLDLKQIHDDLPLFFDRELIGTGLSSHTVSTASSTLSTSADGDAAIVQTFQRSNYQSGKSHQLFFTFSGFQPETNITKKVGYFSSSTTTPFSADEDGFYLTSFNGVIGFFTFRSGTVTNSAFQSNWDDPADGSKDCPAIDWSKGLIIMFDFEWLGVGICRMSTVVDGKIYALHTFNNANSLSDVYMSSGNQPLRYEIRQSGAGSGSFKQICSTVGSEGSINEIGTIQADNLGADFVNANSTANTYALLGIRLQEDKVNTAIDILDFNVLSITSSNLLYKVLINPTVAGTFTYSDVTNSSVMIAKGDTAGNPSTTTVTGGTLLASGYVGSGAGSSSTAASADIVNALRLGMSIAGALDEIVLCVQPLDANADITGSIDWRERS